MQKLIVSGGNKLVGRVDIAPAKNACLPIIASLIGVDGVILLKDAPKITDVLVMAQIIECLGGSYKYVKEGLLLNTQNISVHEADCFICKKARASFFIVGALLARFKKAVVPLPGGCNIGSRPVDIHIDVMEQLGVTAEFWGDRVTFNGKNAKSGKVFLSYPSVGASVNAICLSAFLRGESTISNVAREPEIVDLCNFLNKCGCKIRGIGSSDLEITGVLPMPKINMEYLPIKDRIEAGSYMCMTAITGGSLCFKYDRFEHIRKTAEKLNQMGTKVDFKNNELILRSQKRLQSFNLVADVYPAFPTDMQSLFCSLASVAKGESVIEDRVFKSRFDLCNQLVKMGAKIQIKDGKAIINGCETLKGASVLASDLRAGAALITVGLVAEGVTEICNAEFIDRGYEDIVGKLNKLGGEIKVKF